MTARIICPGGFGGLAAAFAGPDLLPRLEALGDVEIFHDLPDEQTLISRLRACDAAALPTHLSDEVLRAIQGRIQLLAFTGTGAHTYVNVPLARELGITVTNVTGYGDRAVAEQALALLMGVARGIPAGDVAVRAGDWAGWPGIELAGKTIGIVGFGGIGRTFARITNGLGMNVQVWDKAVDQTTLATLAARAELDGTTVTSVDLTTLLTTSDVVSLHLPLTEQTRGMITADHLALLRDGTIVINSARSEIVAEGALEQRAAGGRLLLGLDVFNTEPLPVDDPLLAIPHAVLSPHLGFRTPEALQRMAVGTVECIEAFLAGAPVRVMV